MSKTTVDVDDEKIMDMELIKFQWRVMFEETQSIVKILKNVI